MWALLTIWMLSLSGCDSVAPVDLTSAAQGTFAEFPAELDGAGAIRRYEVPGASRVLVHVRQLHSIADSDPVLDGHILRIQADIERILRALHAHGVRDVFVEGLKPGKESMVLEMRVPGELALESEIEFWSEVDAVVAVPDGAGVRALRREVSDLEGEEDEELTDRQRARLRAKRSLLAFLEEQAGADPVVLRQRAAETIQRALAQLAQLRERFRLYHGADRVLAAEGLFRMRATAADWVYYERRDAPESEERRIVFDERENAALAAAAKHEEPLCVVVFGAAHAFGGQLSCGDSYSTHGGPDRDNLAEWNRRHPDAKFSLIEVDPAHLDESLRYLTGLDAPAQESGE